MEMNRKRDGRHLDERRGEVRRGGVVYEGWYTATRMMAGLKPSILEIVAITEYDPP